MKHNEDEIFIKKWKIREKLEEFGHTEKPDMEYEEEHKGGRYSYFWKGFRFSFYSLEDLSYFTDVVRKISENERARENEEKQGGN